MAEAETINFQEKVQELRKKASAKELTGEHSKSSQQASDGCPLDKCNGSGFLIVREKGREVAKQCDCVEYKAIRRKMDFATIKDKFKDTKITDFQTDRDHYKEDESIKRAKMCKKSAQTFVSSKFQEMKERSKGLYFWSKVAGSGKTMLISAIGNELIENHKANVKFSTAGDLLDAIRETYHTNQPTHELIKTAQKVEVLILDDMGQQSVKADTNDHLFKILNKRMDKPVVTIFSSNCKPEDLPYDYRINSRIKDMAVPIHAPEESARENLAEQENGKILNELLET